MKKFLVLFLLVSLVPFTVGCRLFDKGDDDVAAAAPAPVKLSVPVFVPAVFSPSMRANTIGLEVAKLRLVLEGVTMLPTKSEPVDGGLRVIFSADFPKATFDTLKKSSVDVDANLSYEDPDGKKIELEKVTFARTDLAKIKEDAEVSKDFVAPKPEKLDELEAKITEKLKDNGYTVASYTVIAVTDSYGHQVATEAESVSPVIATGSEIVITVKTNRGYSNTATPTFKIEVSNTTNPDGFATVNTSDKQQTFVSVNVDNKDAPVFTFDVNQEYDAGRSLTSGEVYEIKFDSTDAFATVDGAEIKFTAPATRYIKIP